MDPVVIGPAYSVYVRSVRIALAEKGVAYRLEEFDVFDDADIPPDYLERHPFKRVPAFEHDGFRLYESAAILRYIDEAFPGPPLQPSDLQGRARMNQVLAVLDSYGYWPMVRVIYVQRSEAVQEVAPDEAAIAAAVVDSRRCLGALETLIGDQPFLAGPDLTLADCHAIPMFVYFLKTQEGQSLLAEQSGLTRWWSQVRERPSVAATPFSA